MKIKYVVNNGLAFSENHDMNKLSNYAKKGWILESLVLGGFFYKLRKAEPKDIVYNLDYQTDASEEYFSIMKEAGWERIITVGNHIHIFAAESGTRPIYSDRKTEKDKYIIIREQSKQGAIYSGIIGVVLFISLLLSAILYKPLLIVILGLLLVDMVVFVFSFMPYLAYSKKTSM